MAGHFDDNGNWVVDATAQDPFGGDGPGGNVSDPTQQIGSPLYGYTDNGDGTFTDLNGDRVYADGQAVTVDGQGVPNDAINGSTGVPLPPMSPGGPGTSGSVGIPRSPGTPLPGTSTSPTGTGGSSSFGGGTSLQGVAAAIAAIANAHQLYKDADQYTGKSEGYATQLDPYGSYRKAAADKLAALQNDPSSINQTPGYKFALQEGLGSIEGRDNARFGVGAGSTNPELMRFAQGLASKTYNDQIKQYQDEAGVGIGPAAAGDMLKTGLTGSIAAKTAATGALASIPGTLTNPTVAGTGGAGSSIWDTVAKQFGIG